MRINRAYTLVEIVVVSSIFILLFTILLAWNTNSSSIDKEDTAEQEYYNTLAFLELRLKKDIRSSFTITKQNEKHYIFDIPSINNQGLWDMERIDYKLIDKDRKVVRISNRGDKNYDFSKYLGKKRFILRINK